MLANQVKLEKPIAVDLKMEADDRGWGFYDPFRVAEEYEIQVSSEGQVNITFTRGKAKRVGHGHREQIDCMVVIKGDAIVVAMKRNKDEEIETRRFVIGEHNPQMVIIPPGWWHGVAPVDNEGFVLVYYVTERYTHGNPDEQRFTDDDFDDPELEQLFNQALEVQNK